MCIHVSAVCAWASGCLKGINLPPPPPRAVSWFVLEMFKGPAKDTADDCH